MSKNKSDSVAIFTDTGGTPIAIQINSPKTGKELGRFIEKRGKLHFEGKADKAAKIFVDYILDTFNERIDYLISNKDDL